MKFVVFVVTIDNYWLSLISIIIDFLWIMGQCPCSDICYKLYRDLGLYEFGMVFFGVMSLLLFSGPGFSSATWRLLNRFVKLMGFEVSGF